MPERIPYARTPRKLPVVLGADEVVCFLEAVPSLKARAALTTAYAAGLRAWACCTDPKCGRTHPYPIRGQAMRTEIGRPNARLRRQAWRCTPWTGRGST